mmetsp:Transcript_66970/g.146792  ORF Transcript_66970/g.146792 Transcript_66970/m.146792 type:complete len:204 (+) Transcript_66970:579-1190(+)
MGPTRRGFLGAIFRAKAEVRAMRITSLSSAPACKLSMPGDTQVVFSSVTQNRSGRASVFSFCSRSCCLCRFIFASSSLFSLALFCIRVKCPAIRARRIRTAFFPSEKDIDIASSSPLLIVPVGVIGESGTASSNSSSKSKFKFEEFPLASALGLSQPGAVSIRSMSSSATASGSASAQSSPLMRAISEKCRSSIAIPCVFRVR